VQTLANSRSSNLSLLSDFCYVVVVPFVLTLYPTLIMSIPSQSVDGIGIANLPNQVRLLLVAKEIRSSDGFNQNRGTRLSQNMVLTSPSWLLVGLIDFLNISGVILCLTLR
jgi:hypothetical protein